MGSVTVICRENSGDDESSVVLSYMASSWLAQVELGFQCGQSELGAGVHLIGGPLASSV